SRRRHTRSIRDWSSDVCSSDLLSTYHHLIETMKQMDLPIEVRFGLEVCYTPEAEPFLRDILSQYPYDFLVGSVHSVDGILYDMRSEERRVGKGCGSLWLVIGSC